MTIKENPIIQVKHLSKKYRIGMDRGYKTFSESIVNLLKSPLKTIKNIRKHNDIFWALKDINFEVNRGEILGIIGRNGAGKSTLLKILSRITQPTEGEIALRGRVGSLLEVGTGFHPELTGRENIYFNGAILGMKKQEIKNKFDEIVEFSGVKKFLDTPLKRYSSGMQVRLAFSVAANMDPEILLIDEVLAVGDIEFQKKCLGKMKDVATGGRTVLFVSHNMGAVSSLCSRSIALQNGMIIYEGDVDDAIRNYTGDILTNRRMEWLGEAGDENVKLLHTWVCSLNYEGFFDTASNIEIGIEIEVLKSVDGLILGFTLFSSFGYELAYTLYDDDKKPPCEIVLPGKLIKKFLIPSNTLAQGLYRIEFDVGIHLKKRIAFSVGDLSFKVENISGLGSRFPVPEWRGKYSLFRPNWQVNE